jgi:hypothetical protein
VQLPKARGYNALSSFVACASWGTSLWWLVFRSDYTERTDHLQIRWLPDLFRIAFPICDFQAYGRPMLFILYNITPCRCTLALFVSLHTYHPRSSNYTSDCIYSGLLAPCCYCSAIMHLLFMNTSRVLAHALDSFRDTTCRELAYNDTLCQA